MVAYSFKGRVEPRIQARTKQQTIRAVGRKRHTRPGERMTLTTGDRFHPRLIGEAVCQSVVPIQMDLAVGSVMLDTAFAHPPRLITAAASPRRGGRTPTTAAVTRRWSTPSASPTWRTPWRG